MTDYANDEAVIRDRLTRINEAWQHHRSDAMARVLSECFASDVVMRGPGFSLAGEGREAAVQSYVDFTNQAEVKAFNAEDPTIDVAGDTAVAQYQWQMTYVLAGQEYTDAGHDLFVFSRIDGSWLVVWRALLSS
jgi:ketosteroid isomerase-like protein